MNELLRLTEQISKGYGLGLNTNKSYVAVAMNNDACSMTGLL